MPAQAPAHQLPQVAKFLIVGVSGLVVDLCCFLTLLNLLPKPEARALAIWIAMTWNFNWNRKFTFAAVKGGNVLQQYIMYCLSCLAGALVNWSLCVYLAQVIPALEPYPAVAWFFGVVGGFVLNYTASSWLVFRGGRSQAPATAETHNEEVPTESFPRAPRFAARSR